MTAAITIEDVSKRFRLYHERNQSLKASILRRRRGVFEEFWALKDVSLEIPEGTTFGLIGENGSGKSTLLKCMAKILRPDRGRVAVAGKVSALLELGAGFHPELSGRENLYLNGSILGLKRRELDKIFDEIVDFAGLERFIDMPVKVYSSGMYVRLGFSIAINVDPDVLLVDEVLAVGDEEFQRRCEQKFSDFKQAGKTIVIVSHALGTMRNVCDRLGWLESGELKMVGEPGNVVDDYVGDVHDRERAEGAAADGHGSRWGSGEGRIDRVELLDSNGRPTTVVRTGDAVTIRLHYSTQEPIERPVFGLAVYRLDGVHVTGPNTRDAGCVPDRIDGPGQVDLRIDRLLLVPGSYDLSASMYDYACVNPYDFRHRDFRFEVDHGDPREAFGVVSLGGKWDMDGAR